MDEESEQITNAEEDYEPVVTSTNPNERKLARRLRIQRRIEALAKIKEREEAGAEQVADDEDKKCPIDLQVEQSLEILEKLTIEGNEFVTNVKIANEAREADRRESDGFGREKLLKELEDEATAAQDMFNEIAAKWSGILKYNDPLHINEDIEMQKEKCDELIKQKDAIITNLKAQLRSAEINFARDQRKQNQDINSIARRIEKQVISMRAAFRSELKMIEDVIMAERQLLLEANAKKWDDLAKKRDQEENFNSEKKRDDYWNFIKQMDDLNGDFEELYRATNIKLETDYDDLQKELERIKTEVLMNGEKLDYNYQILKKREDENMIIRSQQKRRINKLQDYINASRKKISEYHKNTSSQIEKLTQEVKKLSRSVLDLDNKCDRVSKCNDQKFFKIWDMNWDRAVALLDKILDIDRILHEQQLGIPWTKPDINLVRRDALPSYKDAVFRMKKLKEDPKALVKPDTANIDDPKTENYNSILRSILHLIEEKTGFLLEDELEAILEPYIDKERTLIKVDNIFSALNVKDQSDIDVLLTHFIPYSYCPICAQKLDYKQFEEETSQQIYDVDVIYSDTSTPLPSAKHQSVVGTLSIIGVENAVTVMGNSANGTLIDLGPLTVTLYDEKLEGECKGPPQTIDNEKKVEEERGSTDSDPNRQPCQFHHPLVINPIYVLKALNDFLKQYHTIKKSKQKIDLTENKLTISRLIAARDIEAYWKKISAAFPPEKEQLWECLLGGLRKYQDVLKDRRRVLEQVQNLRRQNLELQRLFENYVDKNDFPY